MEEIKRNRFEALVRGLIEDSQANDPNWFFSVKFVKKDGQHRNMTARFNVKKHLKGGVKSWKDEDFPHLLTVWEKDKGYRTINVNTVYETCINHVRYPVVD